ncbi:MAG: tRNA (N6-threonylcarbamoyladenosine(37)-N6)-methyltransferase TrmO [Lachnospiraceae bacterium]|nr:tRNA (N6-threonylcarbamoyladenosine(37)-N6)-methyltransferase TrmO [Lachnospiraceae bacterium]MBR1650090.1 tRNA (N6-threonylcarbamoyladenosine(37)-N6)-methyltransferase TrmO [Lachnospiraceae bacterium]
MQLEIIAKMHSPMKEKFGLPRQSGLANELKGTVVFEGKYSDKRAVEGLEGYDYIWLLWEFEGVKDTKGEEFRAMVRPPRLGGNTYMGVFATRSPFRPNPIGMSCVKLDRIEMTDKGPVLHISGADLRDGTPIFDIKPYLPYAEAHPDARGGFTDETNMKRLEVVFEDDSYKEDEAALREILSQDPRPAYQNDPERVYGMNYKDMNVRFRVEEGTVFVIGNKL